MHAIDEITRLQQHPHRQHGRDRRIDEKDDDPVGVRCQAEHCIRQLDRQYAADVDRQIQCNDAADGQCDEIHLPVDQLTDDQRNGDGGPRGEHGIRRTDECVGDDHAEYGVDHQQHEEDDNHEQRARAFADDRLRQGADRLALVTRTRPERAEIVHARKEDRPQDDPEHRRHPSPVNGDRRADDRRSTRNRREMMPPQHILVSGVVIDAVVEFVSRCNEIRIQLIDLCCDELRIDEPAESHACHAHQHDHYGLHIRSPTTRVKRVRPLFLVGA